MDPISTNYLAWFQIGFEKRHYISTRRQNYCFKDTTNTSNHNRQLDSMPSYWQNYCNGLSCRANQQPNDYKHVCIAQQPPLLVQTLKLTPDGRQELVVWRKQIDHINGQEIWHSLSAARVVYSDTSDIGMGILCGAWVLCGIWGLVRRRKKKSSTWRELWAARMVLESLLPKLKNERIRWFSDKQNVVRILEIGSKNSPLQQEALAVFSMVARNLIHIEPEWIP